MTLHLSSSPTSSSLVRVVRTTESTKESCSGVKCSRSSLGLWCLLNKSYPLNCHNTLELGLSVWNLHKCSILWSSFEVFVFISSYFTTTTEWPALFTVHPRTVFCHSTAWVCTNAFQSWLSPMWEKTLILNTYCVSTLSLHIKSTNPMIASE